MANLRIYKPTKDNKGSASDWNISENKNEQSKKYQPYLFFVKIASQKGDLDENGNAQFDWENGLNCKLGDNDLGEILTVLNGKKMSAGYKEMLYHKSPDGGNKIIKLQYKDDSGTYSFSVSGQDKDKQSLGSLYHSITAGEAELLNIFLKKSVEKMYNL